MNAEEDRSWQDVFGDMVYWKFEGIPSDVSVRSNAGFIECAVKLEKGARILDLGPGLGGISIELARRGYEVTGLEWSPPFIEAARRRAVEAGVDVRFIEGDMTRMTFDGEFDAVILWGNTFGMLSDEENVRTLQGIRRALKKGGSCLIDTQNYTALPEKLHQGWLFSNEDQNILMLTQGTKDVLRGRFGFTVLAIDLVTGKRHTMPMSWRLYLLPELRHVLEDVGLELLDVYGDDPAKVDWKEFRRGEPYPYAVEGFTDQAAKRILLCRRT